MTIGLGSGGTAGATTVPGHTSEVGAPSPPIVESETASGDTVGYSWVAGSYDGRASTSFRVCVGTSASGDICVKVPASKVDPHKTYSSTRSFACSTTVYVYVFANDAIGQRSAESNETSTNTGPCQPPTAPGTPGASSVSQSSITWTWAPGSAPGASSYYYSTSFDANVGTATSATQGGLACGTGYSTMVTLTAIYPNGGISSVSSPTGSASTSSCSPPTPTLRISLSSAPAGGVCSSCHWINVSVANFPTGEFTYTCYFSGTSGGTVSGTYDVTSSSWSYDPSGSVANGCAIGGNERVYMVIDGYTSNTVSSS